MKIIVDIGGVDRGIEVPIKAAINMKDKVDADVILVGKKEDIESTFESLGKKDELKNFYVIECSEYISNNEEPAFAIKNKKESNLVKAFNYMKEVDEVVLISASSTGALMAGGLLKVGRIPGIHRPALMSLLPTLSGKNLVFLDSGANPNAKEISLIQYAELGKIYAKEVLDVKEPKIALLNIGAEEEKGTPELKETYKSLREKYNDEFIGNVEARYILTSEADIVVCDGLMGNVALKSFEGAVSIIKKVISKEAKKNPINMLKGLMLKPMLKNAMKDFNYKEHEGAVLIGIKKPVIKVHGSSTIVTFEKAIVQAEKILKTKITEKIASSLKG